MKPTVGRIVMYTPEQVDEQWAAVVTEAVLLHNMAGPDAESAYAIGLHVMPPRNRLITPGSFDEADVPFSPEPKPGHWSWPPRV